MLSYGGSEDRRGLGRLPVVGPTGTVSWRGGECLQGETGGTF